jgi:stage V sporulation protein B
LPPKAVDVARGSFYLTLQNVITNIVVVASFAILARLITPKDMGIWAVLLLVNALCQVTANLGLPTAATRYVADTLARGERDAAASIFYQAIRATVVGASLWGITVFLGAETLASWLLGESSQAVLFRILALDILLNAGMLQVLRGTMLGLRKFRQAAIIGIASTLIRQSLIILLVILVSNFVGLVVGWVISDAATALIYFGYVLRLMGPPRFNFPLVGLVRFSWPLLISGTFDFASSWFDRAVLLAFLPLAALGIYNATIVAFGVLTGITEAMTSTLLPAYSAMQGLRSRGTLTDALRATSRYVSFAAVPLAFGLLATARPALALLVGEAYAEGAGSLMILAGTYGLTLVGTVLSPMLVALGETRVVSAITVVPLAVSLVVALALLPIFGISGAAVARALSMILGTTLAIFVIARKLDLDLDLDAMGKSLVAGVTMAVIVFAAESVAYNKFLLPVYVILGLAAYLGGLRLLKAIRQDDIRLVRSYLGGRFVFGINLVSRILLSNSEH